MLYPALIAWFVLTGLSVVYVAWDAFTRNPELTVMKQALGSTVHCLGGDATGIIFAAAVTATLGLPMLTDVAIEYALGFGFGLLIFQALFMRDMLGGSYGAAVRRSFVPEWLSMNAVMAGMIPVMVTLMSRDMRAMEISSIYFWGIMSLATLVGAIIAYPVNVWLVAVGLKHGMGSVRALGAGGHSMDAEAARIRGTSGELPARMKSGTRSHTKTPARKRHSARSHDTMSMTGGATKAQISAVALLTLLALGAGLVLADLSGGLAMDRTPASEMKH